MSKRWHRLICRFRGHDVVRYVDTPERMVLSIDACDRCHAVLGVEYSPWYRAYTDEQVAALSRSAAQVGAAWAAGIADGLAKQAAFRDRFLDDGVVSS